VYASANDLDEWWAESASFRHSQLSQPL
jgi:hypothetical protein